jgi:tetratricopeptide (TPR) repeat protein
VVDSSLGDDFARLRIAIHALDSSRWHVRVGLGDDIAEFDTLAALDFQPVAENPTYASVRECGSLLYSAIFTENAEQLLELARFRSGNETVALEIEVDDELVDLPWEWLFDPASQRFLALSDRLSLVRWHLVGESLDLPGPTSRSLLVSIDAPSGKEDALKLTRDLGSIPQVEASVGLLAKSATKPTQMVVCLGDQLNLCEVRHGAGVIVVDGCAGQANVALEHTAAIIALPASMSVASRQIFLTKVASELSQGRPVDRAVTVARRELARKRSVEDLDWTLPTLTVNRRPSPLVITEARSSVFGAKVKKRTVGWVTDSMSGVVISIAVFLAGLILYRVGFSSSKQGFQINILSPISLYKSFKSLVVELSGYRDLLLIGICSALFAVTAMSALLWFDRRKTDAEIYQTRFTRHAGPLAHLRSVSILGIATLTVLAALIYRQYDWHVRLPIDSGMNGIALTQASADGEFDSILRDRLSADGERTIVRVLPLDIDARETDRARELANRLGAEAVVIAHPEIQDGVTTYIAYVVIASPAATKNAAIPDTLAAVMGYANSQSAVPVDHLAVPVLRAANSDQLAQAISGVLAYERGDFDQATDELSAALPGDPTAPDAAVINFFLADAKRLYGRDHESASAFQHAVAGFEQTYAQGQLGPVEELLLVKSYLALGEIAAAGGDVDGAISWYQSAIAHRTPLLARQSDLPDPAEFHATYVLIYDRLASAYRAQGIKEEERYWRERSVEEAKEVLISATLETDACSNADEGASTSTQSDESDDDSLALEKLIHSSLFMGDQSAARNYADQLVTAMPDNPNASLIAAATYGQALNGVNPFGRADQVLDAQKVIDLTGTVLADGSNATRVERLAAWSLRIEAARALWQQHPTASANLQLYQESITQAANEVTQQIPTTQFELGLSEQILADSQAFYATVTDDPQQAAMFAAQRSELTSAAPSERLPLVSPSSIACS